MKKVLNLLMALIERILRFLIARKNIAVRFAFTLFYLLLLGIVGFALSVLVLLQFVVLVVTTRQLEAAKTLSHKLTVHAYKILRYVTLNESQKPYPLGKMAEELEPADEVDLSTPLPEKPIVAKASADASAQSGDTKTSEAKENAETGSGEPIILGQDETEEAEPKK